MSESSQRSSTKKIQKQTPDDQQGALPGYAENSAQPAERNLNIPTESALQLEKPDESLDWLSDLEKRVNAFPVETVFKEEESEEFYSNSANSASKDSLQENLPDWLKENFTPEPNIDHQTKPQEDLPEWLKEDVKRLAYPIDGEASSDQVQENQAALPQSESSTIKDDFVVVSTEPSEGETPKKNFISGLFGSKKAESSEERNLSDEELERRLLLFVAEPVVEESAISEKTHAANEPENPPPRIEPSDAGISPQGYMVVEETVREELDEPNWTDFENQSMTPDEQAGSSRLSPEETNDPSAQTELQSALQRIVQEEEIEPGDGYTQFRELALQDYVETPRQTDDGFINQFLQKSFHQISKLSLLQKLALVGLLIADMGLMVLLVFVLVFSLFMTRFSPVSPPPEPTLQVNVPYPVRVTLPGGWSFDVKPGMLQEGAWLNQGAEWLQGTEICRWVALPWNEQLEAVVVTFGSNDHIEVMLNNQDRLEYKVETVLEVPAEKVSDLNLNRPSLLLILANPDSNSRVIVVASLETNE